MIFNKYPIPKSHNLKNLFIYKFFNENEPKFPF